MSDSRPVRLGVALVVGLAVVVVWVLLVVVCPVCRMVKVVERST